MSTHTALQTLLNDRYSCRSYKPVSVSRKVIETILLDAGRAPSWCNFQPWQVHVTSGEGTEAFRNAMLKAFDTTEPEADYFYPTTYTDVRKKRAQTCGYQLYNALGIERHDREGRKDQMRKNFSFFGAPHIAVITSHKELGPYGALDCGGFITSFCLSAQAQGVATVPQASIAYYADAVRQHMSVPDDQLVLAAISFGYADHDHAANNFRTERATLDEMVAWHDE
ncbi:Nitroreductase [Shimia gijangensis]|uniref:Nitroreductase n=1 Tax=Shimia gijangensis TaxID=1470563 RepID=A0A1M6FWA6_9RHOB|nr:nitroreductase [Shimia gijangensis]SHJ01890.1 Nitroreductase [Shimia gijangensis]